VVHQPVQPSFIDFHDAVIASITLNNDSSLIISFDSLNFFYRVDQDEYDVWFCTARIACSGVGTFELNGHLEPDVCISSGSMRDAAGQQVPILTSDETPVRFISLTLLSGTEISISMKSAKLHEFKRIKYLERWSGPLHSVDG
jgi:hypothetical protein